MINENMIKNVKDGEVSGDYKGVCGFELARILADEHAKETGVKTVVRRVVGSFDIVEMVGWGVK